MGKRILLFFMTNLAVVFVVSIILAFLPISYETTFGLAILCFIYGMVGATISLLISKWTAKKFYNVKIIRETNKNEKKLKVFKMVMKLSSKADLPMPEVGIYESDDPNAFATGPSKNNSLVAFSTSLINQLSTDELEAVVGHELSHIQNGDMVTMTLLTGIANAFVMFLSRIIAEVIINYFSDEDSSIGFFGYIAIVWTLQAIFMFLAYIPINMFSRWREYRADNGAALLTSPLSMINALKSMEKFSKNIAKQKHDGYEVAKISSVKRNILFSTHPSTEDRIAALKKIM